MSKTIWLFFQTTANSRKVKNKISSKWNGTNFALFSVEGCKDGRVYLLKFKSSNRKLFFWLQEPNNEKDDEYVRKVNDLLNNPTSASSGGSGGTRGEGSDLQYMLNNMSQQQLMQLFGGVGQMGGLSSLLGSINRNSGGSNRNTSSTPASGTRAATGATALQTPVNTTQPETPRAPRKETNSGESTESSTPAAAAGNTDASRVLLSELQNYLAGINTGGAGGASGSKHNVDLSTSLNSESINSILSDPERLEALQAHLPSIDDEGKPTDPNAVKQQLKDTLASPQFQQALSMFSNALQSGQLGPVVSQFKLSDDAVNAANSGDLEQFVKALEKASIKDKESSAKDDEKDDSKN